LREGIDGTIDCIKQAFGTWQVEKFADHLHARASCSTALMADAFSQD